MLKRTAAFVLAAVTAAMSAVCAFAADEDFSRDMIYCRQYRYYFDKEIDGETAEDEEWQFEFEVFKDATYTVDTVGQVDLTLGANCDYDDEILKAYPEATLLFFNGNGDYFHHYGTLFLPAEKGSCIYASVNSRLYDTGIVYNETEGGFLIRTRYLGQFVISDRALDAPKLPPDSALILENLEII